MKNMKILTTAVLCLLLSFSMGATAMAESITSPDGQLKLDFSVNAQGEPVYELSYKGKGVIKPSKLGLELKNDPGLMNRYKNFHLRRNLGSGVGRSEIHSQSL